MAFVPQRYDEGALVRIPALNSIAFVKGNAVKNSSGYITNAASGDNTDVEYVCMETITTGGTDGELVLCIRTKGVEFLVDTSNTPTQAQMNTYVDLSAAGTIDTSATTDAVFFASRLKGAASDKKVFGHFQQGAINS